MTASKLDIGISRIGQIAITVNGLDRATAFYRDVLGLPLLFTAGLTIEHHLGARPALCSPARRDSSHVAKPAVRLPNLQRRGSYASHRGSRAHVRHE